MMGDPLGNSRVSSHKQNREGVAGVQNGQYRATAESSLGRGGGPGRDVTIWYKANPRPEVCRRGRRGPKGGGL